jgi:hypothetical protein
MRLPGSRGRKRLGPTRQDHGAPHTTRGGHHSQRREIDSSLNASMGIAPSVQLAAFPGPSAWSGSGASWSALCQFVQAASGRPCSSACTKDHHRLQKLQRREGGLSPRNNKAEHKGHDQRWQRSFTNKVPNNGFPLAWRLSRLQRVSNLASRLPYRGSCLGKGGRFIRGWAFGHDVSSSAEQSERVRFVPALSSPSRLRLRCCLCELGPLRSEAEKGFPIQRTDGSCRFFPAILSFPTAVICKALIHERQRVSGVLVYGIDGRTAGLVSAS